MKDLLNRLVLCVERLRDDQKPEIIVHDIECAWERNDSECDCDAINVGKLLQLARHAASTIGQTREVKEADAELTARSESFWSTMPAGPRLTSVAIAFAYAISAAVRYGAAKLQEEQEAQWPSIEEADQQLRDAGLDPEKIAEHGLTFVRMVQENIALKKLIERLEWHLRRKHEGLAVAVKNERTVVNDLLTKAREALR